MMNHSVKHMQKLLAWVMTLALILSCVTMPAMAEGDWKETVITLSWTDSWGTLSSVTAEPIAWHVGQAFWATIPQDAPISALSMDVYHPSHPYTYGLADGYTMDGILNAGDGMQSEAELPIMVYENGSLVDVISLFVSTMSMPADDGNSGDGPVIPDMPEVPPMPQIGFASVEAVWRTTDGLVFDRQQVTVSSDEPYTFYASPIEGYSLITADSVTVYVDVSGNANIGYIEFVYQKNAPQIGYADVTAVWRTGDGSQLNRETVTVSSEQPYTFYAGGYEGMTLVSGNESVTVYVDENGHASSDYVEFVFEKNAPQVAYANVTAVWRMDTGVVIDQQSVQVSSAEPYTFYAGGYEGMTLMSGNESVTVYVDENGHASPDYVEFVFEKNAPQVAYANVTAVWRMDTGVVIDQQSVQVSSAEPYTFYAGSYEGMSLVSGNESVTVYVDENGHASPDQVEFVFAQSAPQVAYAEVTAVWRMDTGNVINQQSVQVSSAEPYTFYAGGYDGMTLVSGNESVTVYVDENGHASPDHVEFVFAQNAPQIAYAEVMVRWTATDGAHLDEQTIQVSSAEPRTIYAGSFEGMTLVSGNESVTVYVDENGKASPNRVEFVFEKQPTIPEIVMPVTAKVMVVWRTEDGAELNSSLELVSSEEPRTFYASEYAGYELVSAPEAITVTVSDSGVASTDRVEFVYRAIPAVTEAPTATPIPNVEVRVYYRSEAGDLLVSPTSMTFPAGTTAIIRPDQAALAGTGYDADTAIPESVEVAITAEGVAKPSDVVFVVQPEAVETPIPQGEMINRWGQTTSKGVNVRSTPSKNGHQLTSISKKGSNVWLIREERADNGESWYRVMVDGKIGFIRGDLVKPLTQKESDKIQASLATPVPMTYLEDLMTPVPVTEVPVTEAPATETPTQMPTEVPVTEAPVTPVPDQYVGYALPASKVELRDGVGMDSSVISTLDPDTLVYVTGQAYDSNGTAWSQVETLDNRIGFVKHAALMTISENDALYYIDQWTQAHPPVTATPAPTAVPQNTPPQITGYAITVGDNVPFRLTCDSMSVMLGQLEKNTVVYVAGQVYETADGWPWHIVQLYGQVGYIRSDMLRMMSPDEITDYLNGTMPPEPTAVITPEPYNESSMSSYGYIYVANGGSVNVREKASTSSNRVTSLRNYALCLVLGTQDINGETWYNIQYNGKTGYVHGNYFKHMTLNELSQFLNSDLYEQGITNNTAANATAAPTMSMEDQNVNQWTGTGTGSQGVSYATWAPIATTAPLATPVATEADGQDESSLILGYTTRTTDLKTTGSLASGTIAKLPAQTKLTISETNTDAQGTTWYKATIESGKTGYVNAADVSLNGPVETATPEPIATPTVSYAPLATVESGSGNENGGGFLGWVLVILAALVIGCGVYAYVVHQNNKRKAAMRNAMRKTKSARPQSANPGPTSGNPAPTAQPRPRTGTYGTMNGGSGSQSRNPYAGPSGSAADNGAARTSGMTQPGAGTYFPQNKYNAQSHSGSAGSGADTGDGSRPSYAYQPSQPSAPKAAPSSYAKPAPTTQSAYTAPVQSAPAAEIKPTQPAPVQPDAKSAEATKAEAERRVREMMAEIEAASAEKAVEGEMAPVPKPEEADTSKPAEEKAAVPEPDEAKEEATKPAEAENAGVPRREGRRMARLHQQTAGDTDDVPLNE